MRTDFRKWLSIGTGVGIEIGAEELEVSVARVRPNGISVLGSATVTEFRQRPAAEWGTELTAFLRKLGCGHIAATVLLPRRDVVVRQIQMPGVNDKDLAAAINLQIDSLHPFAEDEAVFSWSRVGKTSAVLVGITRREVIDRYASLFAEAGVKVASFTFSAAAVYSALRTLITPPSGFLATHSFRDGLEIYGESEARPVFTASFDSTFARAVPLAISELRLPPDTEPLELALLLPKPAVFPDSHQPDSPEFAKHALPYATALAGACPWLSMDLNLLPVEQRKSSSRMRLAPTAALGTALFLVVGALFAHSSYESRRYLAAVQSEAKKLEPQARTSERMDREISRQRAQSQMLDDFRRRSKADMDAVAELTRLLPPPAWVSGLDVTRDTIQVAGEAEQAAVLLEAFDNSPLFQGSEFAMPIARVGIGEQFRIKMNRENSPK